MRNQEKQIWRDVFAGPAASSVGGRIISGLTDFIMVDIGGTSTDVAIVDGTDGRLLGTIDVGRAMQQIHDGAVYLHRGESFVIDHLDLESLLAVAHPEEPEWSTHSRMDTDIRILEIDDIVLARRYHKTNLGRTNRKAQMESYLALVRGRLKARQAGNGDGQPPEQSS